MPNYQAESFYRWTIRQSIPDNTSVPFTLKVSKCPTLTAWLLTLSPNTSNEELIEYDGIDWTALTITVVKRGINPSSQALTTDWTDYNNSSFVNPHSQNSAIRGDVNHLHIIQDVWNLQEQIDDKLAIVGWLRSWMGASRQTVEIDSSWAEVTKAIVDWTSITSTETFRKRKADWTYEEIPFSVISANTWWVVTEDVFTETTITWGDLVWVVPEWLFKLTQELKTSTAIGTATLMDSVYIGSSKYFVVYHAGWTLYWRVASIDTSDAVTYWTATSIAVIASVSAKCTYLGSDKVVVAYTDTTSWSWNKNFISLIGTISWTWVSFWATLTQLLNASNTTVSTVWWIARVRDDAYAVVYDNWVWSWSTVWVNSVSWTTPVAWTNIISYAYWSTAYTTSIIWLSDNHIAVSEWLTVSWQTRSILYVITTWNTTVASSYQYQAASNGYWYMCKYSDTAFIRTNTWWSQVVLLSKPASWSTLDSVVLTSAGGNWYIPFRIGDYLWWLSNNAWTIIIKQRGATILTITSVWIPSANNINYANWRILSFSWATLIPNITNIMRAFYVGVAVDASWKYIPYWMSITKTWGNKGANAYLVNNALVTDTSTTTIVAWKWLNNSLLLLKDFM